MLHSNPTNTEQLLQCLHACINILTTFSSLLPEIREEETERRRNTMLAVGK